MIRPQLARIVVELNLNRVSPCTRARSVRSVSGSVTNATSTANRWYCTVFFQIFFATDPRGRLAACGYGVPLESHSVCFPFPKRGGGGGREVSPPQSQENPPTRCDSDSLAVMDMEQKRLRHHRNSISYLRHTVVLNVCETVCSCDSHPPLIFRDSSYPDLSFNIPSNC